MTQSANVGQVRTSGRGALRALVSRRSTVGWIVACASLVSALPARAAGDLDLTPDQLTTTILLVAFVALVFPLNKLIFRPLLEVMDEREDKTDGSRRRAAQVQAQAAEALARYEDALRGVREEAMLERRAQLEAARAELLSVTRRAKAEAAGELENAREELDASLRGARETLREGSKGLARLAAERILGRSLS